MKVVGKWVANGVANGEKGVRDKRVNGWRQRVEACVKMNGLNDNKFSLKHEG